MSTTDRWIVEGAVAYNLVTHQQLRTVQQIKQTTNQNYETILREQGLVPASQLQQLKKMCKANKAKKTLVEQPTFEKYQVIKKLGEGNFGDVFLVRDVEWNKNLALKILKENYLKDQVSIKRFEREAEALAQLNHPGIVKVYKFGKHNNRIYYTMDYIEGQSLSNYLEKEKRLSCRRAARLTKEVAEIVHYAHKQNIVHRDIKPENIMIDGKGKVYLTDFGLAKSLSGSSKLSQTGHVTGTPAYMSPEQAQGMNKLIDERSDIYSIGATLYELVTGRIPFSGKNPMTVMFNVVNKPPSPPRSIQANLPDSIDKICLKCLEKKPQNRYKNAGELIQDLDAFLQGKVVRTKKELLHLKKYKLIGILALVLLLIGFILYHNQAPSEKLRPQQKDISKLKQKPQSKQPQRKLSIIKKKHLADFKNDYQKSHKNRVLQQIIVVAMRKEFPQKATNYKLENLPQLKELNTVRVFRGRYYGFFHSKLTWKQARNACRNMGGDLVVIDNKKCNDVIIHGIRESFITCSCWGRCWIGLRKRKNGDWYWINNKKVTYENWYPGEPNNTGGTEEFGEMMYGPYGFAWNDNQQTKQNFICEWKINR